MMYSLLGLNDNLAEIVTKDELQRLIDVAMEFDGFYGFMVHAQSEDITELVDYAKQIGYTLINDNIITVDAKDTSTKTTQCRDHDYGSILGVDKSSSAPEEPMVETDSPS